MNPVEEKVWSFIVEYSRETFDLRTKTDSINLYDWLFANHQEFLGTLSRLAVTHGNIPVMRWLFENHRRINISAKCVYIHWGDLCSLAAEHQQFEMLKYLYDNGCKMYPQVCIWAAENGDVEMFAWASSNGAIIAQAAVSATLKGDHVEIITWLYNSQSVFLENKETIMNWCASDGAMRCIKFLHSKGYPLGPFVCAAAAIVGKLEMLQWLREHDCPWHWNTYGLAITHGHYILALWAYDNGCPIDKCIYPTKNKIS
jgi:hypothetical protein